jgi:hypothetical protein
MSPRGDESEDWFMIDFQRLARRIGVVLLALLAAPGSARAAVSNDQERAAEEYLSAVVLGDPRAIALSIHEQQLELLRRRIVEELRLEADRNDNVLRTRLFGAGMPLGDIERLTPQGLFVALAARLRFNARPFERIEWLDTVKDEGGLVHVVGRLRPAAGQGDVRVPVLVSLVPWGEDWKAAVPFELQAQLDDLKSGRTRAPGVTIAPAPTSAGGAAGSPAPASTPADAPGTPREILDLLDTATANLRASRCEEFYTKNMSPNFRRTTAPKALRSLISACELREEVRERVIAALTLARGVPPQLQYGGTRAVFDLRGKGLPYNQLVVEQVDKRWYVAD